MALPVEPAGRAQAESRHGPEAERLDLGASQHEDGA